MEELPKKTPHVYIVGQTASGKSSFAFELAQDLDLEILNTDSLLFYKGLDIGTAKPSLKERSLVKHYMIDLCEIGEDLSAADYARKARPILEEGSKKVLCVGGSGFYINALDVGLLPLPHTDPLVKAEVLKIENPVQLLKEQDLEIFNKISENDLYRVRRALEVFMQTGKPLSQWQKEFSPKPFAKKIAFFVAKEELLKRVSRRCEEMLKSGFLEEVEAALKQAPTKWRPLFSVGYKESVLYLTGKIQSKEELKNEIIKKTMQLAKKQKTWFRKDKSVIWFDFKNRAAAKEKVKIFLEEDLWRV